MNYGTHKTGQLRQPTTSLHTWPIAWDIKGCLCLLNIIAPDIPLTRASQNPIRPIRRTRAADFGPSLSMFKKAADIEVSYKTMYVCTAAEKVFVTSCPWLIKLCVLYYNFNKKAIQ